MKLTRAILCMVIMIFFIGAGIIYAAGQSSANYTIDKDAISGGGGSGGSASYGLKHTTGQPSAIGDSLSDNYVNYAGFWNTIISGTVSGLLGDINGDGVVDISDVILVLRCALGLLIDPYQCMPCGDINRDGVIDISDVILTLRMALGLDPMQECY